MTAAAAVCDGGTLAGSAAAAVCDGGTLAGSAEPSGTIMAGRLSGCPAVGLRLRILGPLHTYSDLPPGRVPGQPGCARPVVRVGSVRLARAGLRWRLKRQLAGV